MHCRKLTPRDKAEARVMFNSLRKVHRDMILRRFADYLEWYYGFLNYSYEAERGIVRHSGESACEWAFWQISLEEQTAVILRWGDDLEGWQKWEKAEAKRIWDEGREE